MRDFFCQLCVSRMYANGQLHYSPHAITEALSTYWQNSTPAILCSVNLIYFYARRLSSTTAFFFLPEKNDSSIYWTDANNKFLFLRWRNKYLTLLASCTMFIFLCFFAWGNFMCYIKLGFLFASLRCKCLTEYKNQNRKYQQKEMWAVVKLVALSWNLQQFL